MFYQLAVHQKPIDGKTPFLISVVARNVTVVMALNAFILSLVGHWLGYRDGSITVKLQLYCFEAITLQLQLHFYKSGSITITFSYFNYNYSYLSTQLSFLKYYLLTLLLLGLGLELVFSYMFPTLAPDFHMNAGEPA